MPRIGFHRVLALTLTIAVAALYPTTVAADAGEHTVAYDAAFWGHWSDGRAELAGYDLTYSRYGAMRHGSAVTIFVKEEFSNDARVKADAPGHDGDDTFPVLKLNLVQDFPTGIYDYNLMTSAFLALVPVNGRPAGTLTKASFSAQEWCGHAYHQLLFDSVGIRDILHSYFEGEADRTDTLDYPNDGVSADALQFWARGLAEPRLEPGESVQRPLLRSLETSRLRHQPVAWETATFARAAAPQSVTVPAGTFDADVYTVTVAGKTTHTFYVERTVPYRVVKWEMGDGGKAELLATTRLPYWKLHDVGQEQFLQELRLTPRPARTP